MEPTLSAPVEAPAPNTNSAPADTTAPVARLSLGATEAEVRQLLGEPAKTNVFAGETAYFYGRSQIKFLRGTLTQWYTVDQPLPMFLADAKANAAPIRLGSSTNEVLEAMGTPTGLIALNLLRPQEIWHYGASSLVITNGAVESWRDAWNLAVTPKTNNLGDTPLSVLLPPPPVQLQAVTNANPATNSNVTIIRFRPRYRPQAPSQTPPGVAPGVPEDPNATPEPPALQNPYQGNQPNQQQRYPNNRFRRR